MIVGTEWLIEATDCEPERLRDESLLRDLLERVIDELGLKSVGAVWHKFPGASGITGLVALTESHLACHTYPEHGTATFNLYCCRTRPEWDWESNLKSALLAGRVSVMKIERGDSKPASQIAGFNIEMPNLEPSNSAITDPTSEIPNQASEISNPSSEISNLKSRIAGGEA